MVIDFSKVNCSDRPMLLLKNLDGTTIDVIGFAFNVEADLAYNEISSISFDVPSFVDNERVPYYDKIVGMRIVELVGVGQFLLVDPSEENDGIRAVKSCKGYSLEYEFTKKSIYLEAGTYNFFSGINSSNSDTIIGRIKEKLPDWNFTIDPSLIGKYRTFDDIDKKVYDFIKSDVQESFGCIFNFDTENRAVSVVSASGDVETKQVYLSKESLIKTIQIDEDSDSIVTCLDVNGDDNINIRSVNPTGTNKIYNLDYFMTTDYFSQGMIDKWNTWKSDYESARSEYYDITMSYDMKLLNIAMKENELSDLNGELQSLENLQAVIIQGISSGIKHQSDLNAINTQIANKKSEIDDKANEVSSLKSSADSTLASLSAINDRLAFEQYFSQDEMTILRRYFIEDTIQDSSFVPATSATYSNEDLNSNLSDNPLSISGASIEDVDSGSSTIYSIAGGSVSVDNLTADIVKGTIELSGNGTFVFTAYLNSGLVSSSSFKSGNITISGSSSEFTHSFSDISMTISNGRLYFTKNSTVYEEHQIEWDLYDYGKSILLEHSSPTYNFTVDCANFLTSDDYLLFHNQLTLGKRIYIDIDGEVLQPYVVSVHIDFESRDGFSIQFSSSYTSFDKSFALTKLLEQSVSMGKTLSYKSGAYSSFVNSGASNMVKEFMDSSLDIAKKSVMSSGNQAITYSDTGMRVRKWSDEGKTTYEPEEIWIVDNMIAFTDDNWSTAKMAIGKIFDPNFTTGYKLTTDTAFVGGKTYYTYTNNKYAIASVIVGQAVPANTYYEYAATNNTVYGIAAPYLVGTMVAGENLFIESTKPDGQNMSFRVDGSGASLYNAKFIVKDNSREIVLDPKLGFGIGSGSIITTDDDGYETWNTDGSHAKFWVNPDGSVHMKGTLEGCDGVFSGRLSAASGTFTGELSAASGTFSGDVSGGSIHIGANGSGYNFVVDSSGNLTANGGSFRGAVNATSMSINGSSVLTNTDALGNATNASKIKSDYLDLGNITLDGRTGNITLGGSIYISGNIQWNSSNSPVSVQYSQTGSSWHTSISAYDYYARYSYDGGSTWTSAVQIRGRDGYDGSDGRDGSDASVTWTNIYRALYSSAVDGIYANNGDICICATYIRAGDIDADSISLSSNSGGFCCAYGYDGVRTTHGAKMYGSDDDFYFIATNAGVRMQSPSESFYVTDGSIRASVDIEVPSDRRFKNTISSDMNIYREFYKNLKPSSYKLNNGKSNRLHIGFIAQEVEDALINGGLTTQDFAGLVKCSGENDSHMEYVDEYSLRYSEFIALNTYMIQDLLSRVSTLEKTIEEMKGEQ